MKNNLNNGISTKNAVHERVNLAEQQQQQQQQQTQQQTQQSQPLFTQEEVNAKLKALELDFQNQLKDDDEEGGGGGGRGGEGVEEAERSEARKIMNIRVRKLETENNQLKRVADEMKTCMAEYEVTIQHLMRGIYI